MDINICQATFKKFEASIENYLRLIGNDIYDNHLIDPEKVSNENFIGTLLRKRLIQKYKHVPEEREIAPENRCQGRIWKHVEQVYVQCNKTKKDGMRFCNIHLKKRNYGEITN
jgi:hypothetical protein